MKLKHLTIIFFLIVSINTHAATIIVNPASATQPQVNAASPGDTLLFAPGTHDRIHFNNFDATECSPLVLMSQDPGNPARLYEANLNNNSVIYIEESEYIYIENLVVEGALYGIRVQCSNHIIVRDCEVMNTGQEGTKTHDRSSYVDWINNKVHHTGTRPGFSGYGECFYLGTGNYTNSKFNDADSTRYVWIENNEIYNCGNGEAIEFKGWVKNSTARGNHVHDIAPGTTYQTNEGAVVLGATSAYPSQNWVENNTVEDITWGHTGGAAIVAFGAGGYIHNNNVGDAAEAGIYFNGYLDPGHFVYEWNNTINNNTGPDYKGLNNLADLRQVDPGITNPNEPQAWCGTVPCRTPDLGADLELCASLTEILDASITDTGYSFIWTKDGTQFGGAGVSETADEAGTYAVSSSKIGCPDASDTILVTTNLPSTVGDTVCMSGTANLLATGSGNLNWFDQSSGGASLQTGTTYSPFISTSTTYYVESGTTVKYTAGRAQIDDNWDGGNYWDRKLRFTLQQTTTIDSVTVDAKAAQTVHVRILDSDNTTVLSDVSRSVSGGVEEIHVGATLPSGVYYIDAEGSTGILKYENENATPQVDYASYTIPGVISFESEPAFESTSNPRWRYFYRWKITTGGTCARVPVEAVIDPGNPSCIISGSSFESDEFIIYPNPTKGVVHFNRMTDFEIIDIFGNIKIVAFSDQADLSNLPEGIYILRTVYGERRIVRK